MISKSLHLGDNRPHTRKRCRYAHLIFIAAVLFAFTAEPADAKRTVKGKITDAGNRPVVGLLVRAWDSDDDKNDFMGQTYTDANGNYSIPYSSGHWDPWPHNIVKWRPDIFIKVLVYADGHWIKTAQSPVTNNHPHRYDLTINLSVPSNTTRQKFTKFKPIFHGLPFPNQSRVVCGLPSCKGEHSALGFLKDIFTFNWALCGGMSLTALEDFRAGRQPAGFSPEMKARLVANQIKTLAPTFWYKFLEWQAKPTLPHTFSPHTIGVSTKGEWPKVRQAIDAGAPIILGLIRNQDATGDDASKNHQVLAVGYAENALTTKKVIYVYDPNYCNKALGPDCNSAPTYSTFTFYTGIPQNQIKAKFRDPDGNVVPRARGFFVIPRGSGPPTSVYAPKVTATLKASTAMQATSQMQVNRLAISKVIRRGGADPDESTITEDDSVASEEAVKSYMDAVAEWEAEEDDAATLDLLDRIQAARDATVTTRGLKEDAAQSEELLKLISPDQFEPPLPPK